MKIIDNQNAQFINLLNIQFRIKHNFEQGHSVGSVNRTNDRQLPKPGDA